MEQSYQRISVDNILYACGSSRQRSSEQFVQVHALVYVLSGEIHFTTAAGTKVVPAGTMALVRRNQLVKTTKLPAPGGEFRTINIFLSADILRPYSAAHTVPPPGKYYQEGVYGFPADPFITGYFQSLQPYFDQPDRLTPVLTELKTKEAIELLLTVNPALEEVLFHFGEPHKIDLEAFMLQNYRFNVSVDSFARLTGRSRAGFKRDFEKVFKISPGQWLKQKRLQEAYFLIKEKGEKPSDVYLDVGFENLSHFSYAFKQAYGINPSAL
ncbi:AraC family transcriptional regulator [Paraflavisolibacter sp. H34]|uniref:helix-turn-helix domain-containing protein n=1 Tax=Huijunlia imazamoxiresistens TaxID=3127457 RepID=UPI003018A42C